MTIGSKLYVISDVERTIDAIWLCEIYLPYFATNSDLGGNNVKPMLAELEDIVQFFLSIGKRN